MTATQHLSISETNGQLDNLYSYDLRLGQSSQKTGMTRFCQDLAHFYEYVVCRKRKKFIAFDSVANTARGATSIEGRSTCALAS